MWDEVGGLDCIIRVGREAAAGKIDTDQLKFAGSAQNRERSQVAIINNSLLLVCGSFASLPFYLSSPIIMHFIRSLCNNIA